jgi:hypothetical protein
MTLAVNIAQSGSNNVTFRNRLINGNMGIWQRGTSSSSNGYLADRWFSQAGSSYSGSQSSDAPTGFKYSLSISGSGYPQMYQRIESTNCTDLVGQPVTISFWAKQSSGGGASSLFVQLYYAVSADTWSSSTQIGSTATFTGTSGWVQYSTTFTSLPSGAANGLQVAVGAFTAGSGVCQLSGIQLEAGTTASPFEYRQYGTELVLCQRYYEKSFPATWVPGTASFATGFISTTSPTASGGEASGARFIVPKRASPTVVTYNAVTGASASAYRVSTGANVSSGPTHLNEGAIGYIAVPAAADGYYWHFTASAEL